MSKKAPNRTTANPPVQAITTYADGTPAGVEFDPHTAPAKAAGEDADPAEAELPGRKTKKTTTDKE